MTRLIFILSFAFTLNLNAQQPTLKNGLESFVNANTVYPIYALEHCIQGTIEVAFKLNRQGKVTYATITKGVGADLDEEALRLIQLTSGKWQMPLAYDTTFLIRSPMRFSLQDYGCEKRNPASAALAVKQYADQMATIQKIANFYRNRAQGIENFIKEEEVLALKDELGINEDYISRKLRNAEKKIRQGDLQSACEDFKFVKYMGFTEADKLLARYCK